VTERNSLNRKIVADKSGIRIALIVALTTMMLLFFQYVYIDMVVKRDAEAASKELAKHTAKEIANSVEVYFRDALSISNAYAANFLVYKQNNLSRNTIYKLLEGSLRLNDNFLAIWTMWEPNAYDNRDPEFANDGIHDPKGSFAMAYYYDNHKIVNEINDTLDYLEDFYILPKQFKKPLITDPFYYQYHGNQKVFFESSLISPIMQDDHFLGVIGIDIDMYALQAKYKDIRVFDEGYVAILSNSGNIVTHQDQTMVEKTISLFTGDDSTLVKDKLLQGDEFTIETQSQFTGKSAICYYFPINMDYMAAPWYILIEIPSEKVFEKANSLRKISTYFLIFSILLLTYLFYNIIDRRHKEKYLLQVVSDLKKSEEQNQIAFEQLWLSEKKLEAIFNQTFSLGWILDSTGHVLMVNQPALTYINKQEKEVQGLCFVDTPWWQNVSEIKAQLSQAIIDASKGIHISFETLMQSHENCAMEVLFSIKPIKGSNKSTVNLLTEATDISKIKEVERELKRYQEHLEALVFERSKEIILLNNQLQNSNEELMTTNEQILRQKEELQNTLEQLKKVQDQLVLSGKMASLGLFTAGIAHEINNPINFISASSQALFNMLDELKNLPVIGQDEVQTFLKTAEFLKQSITIGIDRTNEIILSLRNYSNNNSDDFSLYAVEKCIKDALIILQGKYKGRISIIEQHCSNTEIECISGKISQLFVNILANSIDAISDKGTIHICTERDSETLKIDVSDSGEGIEPENLKKLFDPFFTTKPVGKGVGLGMYIAYGIVEKHAGKILVESELGKGTVVTILLPILANQPNCPTAN
jgi:signal transduction histidine kinase